MSLSKFKVGAAIPVTDVSRAKEFYEGKLGLENGRDVEDGGHHLPLRRRHRDPCSPVARRRWQVGRLDAAWEVDDIESVVDDLDANGSPVRAVRH